MHHTPLFVLQANAGPVLRLWGSPAETVRYFAGHFRQASGLNNLRQVADQVLPVKRRARHPWRSWRWFMRPGRGSRSGGLLVK